MCRILFAAGEGEEVKPLIDAIVKASQNDPYKEKRGKGRQHKDGWGYVMLKEGSVRHYRSMRPIFEDERTLEKLKEELDGFVVLMIHARAASQGVKSLFNVQPFSFSSRRGFTFWLLHNGDLDKERIISLAELNKNDLEMASDSYVFATYLCRRLESTSLPNLLFHYRVIEETLKTAFNTMTLFHDSKKGFRAFITARMRDEFLGDQLEYDYYRLLLLEKKNFFAVASSTVELYYPEKYKTISNETAFKLRIDGENFEVKRVHL